MLMANQLAGFGVGGGGSISGPLIPTMTQNSSGGFTASASHEVGGGAFQAFDDNAGTKWAVGNNSSPGTWWLEIELDAAATAKTMSMVWNGYGGSYADWTLEGSNNGTDWTQLSTGSNSVTDHVISTTGSFLYYRLTESSDTLEAHGITSWQLFS